MGISKGRMILSVLLASMCLPAVSQTLAQKGWAGSNITVAPWWQSAILYQIDPVSFQDSNGDGFGDLRGISERLEYLQTLGVDALVITPLQSGADAARPGTAQPFDPVYGGSEDLDQLVQLAGLRKIRIFVDVPLSRAIPLQETVNLARFWLSRGIAGLRLTEDSADAAGSSTAQILDRVRELKRLCASYPGQRVLFWDARQPIGPTEPLVPRRSAARHHGRRRVATAPTSPADAPQLRMNSLFASMPVLDAASLRRVFEGPATKVSSVNSTKVVASDNSGLARSLDRFGEGPHEVDVAKVLATVLLGSPAAPLLYFGQEIGMATTPAPTVRGSEASQLPPGDPTPMQWGDARGFSSAAPWLAMGRNATTANVAMEELDRFSLLNWYRRLIALRHANAVMREGSLDVLNEPNPAIVAWVRRARADEASYSPVVILCNVSDRPVVLSISAELHRLGIATGVGVMHTLAASDVPAATVVADRDEAPVSINSVALPAYGVYVGELRRQAGLETLPAPVRSRRAR